MYSTGPARSLVTLGGHLRVVLHSDDATASESTDPRRHWRPTRYPRLASSPFFFSGKPGAHVRFHGAMGSTHVEKGYRFRAREIIVAGRFVISGKIVPASNVVDSNFLGKGGWRGGFSVLGWDEGGGDVHSPRP